MDHSESTHGGEHGGGVHLPDPSIWPLILGFTFALVGAALIYYSRDPDASFSGPLLGAAAIVALLAGCGWAYEDGRMKRKAEEGLIGHGGRDARYTQVVTFGIAEGQYLASRAEGGIVSMLEGTDNSLRDLDGFQDLRVIASPADDGVSQVLVETTWADREGLATYEETRTTMLDLLAQNPDQVVPGSVQVFDMEVVRDTKDTSFNFGTGAMVGTFASLIVGGFMIGAGLTLFESDHAGGTGGGGEPAPADAGDTIVAQNTTFTQNEITAPPNTEITLKFDNKDASPPHNVQIFAGSQPGGPLLTGCTAGCEGDEVATPLGGGPKVIEFTFTTPAVGEYAFNCLAHPTQMTGTLTIAEGAPVPGAGAAPSGGGAGQTIVADNTKFTQNKVTVPANTEVTLKFDNKDASPPHNVQIFAGNQASGPLLTGCTAGCDGAEVHTPLKGGPAVIEFTFTSPGPGEYAFNCLAHPTQMTGTMTVQ